MKMYRSAAVAALILGLGLVVSRALGQQAVQPGMPAPQGGITIALLDVNYIYNQHIRFKSSMEQFKADVQRARDEMKKRAESLQAMQEQLRKFKPGTEEYRQTEEMIAKTQADVSVQAQLQQKEFLQREAKIYHSVYQEIQQEVQYYASQHGIAAVLRFSGDPVDKDQPDDVLRGINQPVVWYNPAIDITPHILAALNQRGATAPPTEAYRPAPQGVPFPPRR